jgi:predicted nucleic acid-binding protein
MLPVGVPWWSPIAVAASQPSSHLTRPWPAGLSPTAKRRYASGRRSQSIPPSTSPSCARIGDYFDAAYIAKCYLNEPGADRVREVAYGADGLGSCELARLEFASILKRHVREHHVTRRELTAILKDFEADEQNGVWQWLGVTSEVLEKARKAVLDLPSAVFVRSGDALHLACAEEHGFQEIYTNDRHMLQAAKHFHVIGVNVLSEMS